MQRLSRPIKTIDGFTLVELLVVISIIGVLVALLLPAVSAARESARRSACSSNLKNVTLALIQYEDLHKTFPTGYGLHPTYGPPLDWAQSWSRDVLPYLEQGDLHDAWDFSLAPSEGINRQLASTPIDVYKCPSSPGTLVYEVDYYRKGDRQRVGVLDYVPTNDSTVLPEYCPGASTDDCAEKYPDEGIFAIRTVKRSPGIMQITITMGVGSERRKVLDGMSHTTLLTEKSGYPEIYFGQRVLPETDPLVWSAPQLTWVGQWARRNRLTFEPPPPIGGLPANCSMNCTNFYEMQPFSFHRGGCFFGMGDGAVRFIREDITPDLLARLITRDDGQYLLGGTGGSSHDY